VAIGGPDAFDRLRTFSDWVNSQEIDLDGVDQLLKDLLLRDKIGVKASVRHARFVTNVGNARPQESIAFEDFSGCLNELLS